MPLSFVRTLALPALMGERDMFARAVAGDAKAFRQIYDRHAASVHRFLCDLFGDEPAADEATQETFVRAYRALASMRDQDRLVPWLFGIARNVYLETLRQRKRTPLAIDDADLGDAEEELAPTPETALLMREADEVLSSALLRLSPDRRAALLLQMDHGLSYGEIAETLGWSLPKVKIEIHRARRALRVIVETYLGGSR